MKTMKERIRLHNRDGACLWLQKEGDHYCVRSRQPFYLDHLRAGINDGYDDDSDSNVLNFIDPPGGPFLSQGYPVTDDLVIEKILGFPIRIYLKKSL